MTPSERWLTILMRVVGTAALFAIVAVFMPRAWIDRCHEVLRFGPLPDGPVVEYLARCTSLAYVLAGVVQWWLSLDVRRYGRAIVGLGVIMLVSGMVLLWIDIVAGMPPWWTVMEGPFGVGMGAVYLILQFRSRVEVLQKQAAAWTASPPGPAEQEPELEPPAPPAAQDDEPTPADSGGQAARGFGEGFDADRDTARGSNDAGEAAGPDEPERGD